MADLIITDRNPAIDATGVFINDVIWVRFSAPVATSSVTYYNFTVNERNTYLPVEGNITFQSVSGGVDDAIAVFLPTTGLVRNTDYAVFLSTGISGKVNNKTLDHDYIWYFKTGNEAASGVIGETIFNIDPSGFTLSIDTSVALQVASGANVEPLQVIDHLPEDQATNQPTNIPFIFLKFNAPIPTGIVNLYKHIQLTSRNIKRE